MALLKPQEFANKERPEMPTKYGTHLGGGFPSLREAYQEHIGNDSTLRALQDVSANADLASAQKAKGQCTLTDFERQLVGISIKVDPFRLNESQNYEALYNQKMSALSMQEAFNPKANLNTFNPSGNIKLSPNAMKYLTAAQEQELERLRAKYRH